MNIMDGSSSDIPNQTPGIKFEKGQKEQIRAWAKDLKSSRNIEGREIVFDEAKIKNLSPEQKSVVIAAFDGQVPGGLKISQERVKVIMGELINKKELGLSKDSVDSGQNQKKENEQPVVEKEQSKNKEHWTDSDSNYKSLPPGSLTSDNKILQKAGNGHVHARKGNDPGSLVMAVKKENGEIKILKFMPSETPGKWRVDKKTDCTYEQLMEKCKVMAGGEKPRAQAAEKSEKKPEKAQVQPSPIRKTNRTEESQYLSALKAPNLDSSEFALLAIGYIDAKLRKNPNLDAQKELDPIKARFSSSDFLDTTTQLILYCKTHKDLIDPQITAALENRAPQIKNDPNANHSRRFFETRLANHLKTEVENTGNYKSVAGLSETMKKLSSESDRSDAVLKLPSKMSNLRNAVSVIGLVATFNDNIEKGLKLQSEKYQKKDREKKSRAKIGEEDTTTTLNVTRKVAGETEAVRGKAEEKDNEKTFSRNVGIMKSITPNFTDLRSEVDIVNRVVDGSRVEDVQGGFSSTHAEIPFVNSISGTTFSLVKLLGEYIDANQENPELEKHVNNIVQTFIAVYIEKGFHGIGEMEHVLKEPHIQEIFNKSKINLDVSFPTAVLKKTFEEAQAFTLTNCLKKAMQSQLK